MHWLRARILSTTDVEQAILLASFYGEIKHFNSDGMYFDEEVEGRVVELLANAGIAPPLPTTGAGDGVALIASDLLDHGGHTNIVLKWLEARPMGLPHKLIVTRTFTKRTRDFLNAIGCELVPCANYSSDAVRTILRHCASARTIVLLIHPDDIVAAAASRLLEQAGRTVIFYNHADHCFSFGIRSSTVVAEMGHFGQAISQRSGRTRRACWAGIPAAVTGSEHPKPGEQRRRDGRVVMACGSAGKFRPVGGLFFGDFIDGLLAVEPEAKVVLIGPSGREAWWQAGARRWGSRVEFRGPLPHARFLSELDAATVFVDGFPMGGGTSFIEALLAGKLCAGLTLPIIGYSHSDSLRVRTVPDLVERVQLLLRDSASAVDQVHVARRRVSDSQSFEAFVARIESIYRGDYASCVNPFPAVDADAGRWYERTWEEGGKLHIPTAGTLRQLPYWFRLQLLFKLLPLGHITPLHNLIGILGGRMTHRAIEVLSGLLPRRSA